MLNGSFLRSDHEFLELYEKNRLRIDFDFYRISRNESQAILAALEIIRFIRCIYDAILLFVPFVQFVVVSTFNVLVHVRLVSVVSTACAWCRAGVAATVVP